MLRKKFAMEEILMQQSPVNESPVLRIETLSDGRIVIYVEDPSKVIVLQKTIPLPPKLEGYHE